MDPFIKINIIEYRDRSFSEKEDTVVTEKRLRIFSANADESTKADKSGKKEIVNLLCTPTMIKELIVGFALSEGFLSSEKEQRGSQQAWCAERIEIFWKENDIEVNLPIETPEAIATLTSGCAKGITFSANQEIPVIHDEIKVSVDAILERYREFQKKSELFKATGGVHSAALCDEKEMIVFSEDIGRHNAVDKIIGYAFLENISMQGKLLLLSGRLSSEITQKAVKAGVPILVSRAAPTDMAVDIAKKANITLIGFLRGQHLNIYSNPVRVIEGYRSK
jgi:FdhD protein